MAMMHVSDRTHATRRQLAAETGASMQEIADRAVEAYRPQLILEQANAAYAELRADPDAWEEESRKRAEWDVTLSDGLEDG